jgi:hypothetical protein
MDASPSFMSLQSGTDNCGSDEKKEEIPLTGSSHHCHILATYKKAQPFHVQRFTRRPANA